MSRLAREMPRDKMTTSDQERFWAKVNKAGPTDCWEWTASRKDGGYGQFRWRGQTWQTARWVYVLHHGSIGVEEVVDHLCRNPPCVNPAHLEAVTHAENIARGISRNALITHCPKGHPYGEESWTQWGSGDWHRECRPCRKTRARARAQRPEVKRRQADKQRAYMAEYRERPGVREKIREKARAERAAETPEERAARNARAREAYRRRKEAAA